MKYCRFLEHWRRYTQGNETPEIMHLWVGLSTLAGAVEKRAWIDQGYFKVYFNLYVILVAPPGVVAKSVSMDLGRQALEDCNAGELPLTVLGSAITKEAIIEEMALAQKAFRLGDGRHYIHTSVTLIADELNVLLSTGVDTVKFLVEIFGAPKRYTYRTKTQGQFELINPYLNLMAAVVPQWFGSGLANDLGATGFLARCILVYEDQKRGLFPRTILTEEQLEHRRQALEILEELTTFYGQMELTEEAQQLYHDWYMAQEFNPSEDYRILSYLERRTKVHVLKIAGLMALGDLRHEITKVDLERAIHILQQTEVKLRLAYLFAGNNKYAVYIQRIVNLLSKEGRVPLSLLVRQFYAELTAREFKEIVEYLELSGLVKRHYVGGEMFLEQGDSNAFTLGGLNG